MLRERIAEFLCIDGLFNSFVLFIGVFTLIECSDVTACFISMLDEVLRHSSMTQMMYKFRFKWPYMHQCHSLCGESFVIAVLPFIHLSVKL